MKKYFIQTFGCNMNESDSERIKTVVEGLSYQPTTSQDDADLLIFNTCAVRQSAENRVIGQLEKVPTLRKAKPDLKVIIAGCMVQENRDDLAKRLPEVDIFLSIRDLPQLPQKLGFAAPEVELPSYMEIRPTSNLQYKKVIPIISGCDNFCTFCVVPYARGRELSRRMEDVLTEVSEAVAEGAKEIWLVGQIVNHYQAKLPAGKSSQYTNSLAVLLEQVNALPGDFRVTFTSSHPNYMTEDLVRAVVELPKVMPYIHLPVQAGNDEILLRMNRKYTAAKYREVIAMIHRVAPEICFTTDILLGFCNETEDAWNDTIQLFKDGNFAMAYINQYSQRPNTVAARFFKDNIPRSEKIRRDKEITEVLRKQSRAFNEKFIGTTVRVLVDEKKGKFLLGKSDHFRTVKFIAPQDAEKLMGSFVHVAISGCDDWGLKGVITEDDVTA